MRHAFCDALGERHRERPIVFFTGDLGFMALEPLRERMGERFINAGIAEQNMISVAAGVASLGEQCWTYSIAPFVFGRPFEQIRNDVCLHKFDVKIVGNGGGYGYGVMGGSHHALEDYGALLTLQHMRVYVPAFAEDVAPITKRMAADANPGYLRLGRCEKPTGFVLPDYTPWRRLLTGDAGVLIVIGPNAGDVLEEASPLPVAMRPEIWVLSELPLETAPIPEDCRARIAASDAVFVLEEHVAQGSVGRMIAADLLSAGQGPRTFRHFAAKGYPSGRYGSQAFHRRECGLDAASVLAVIRQERSVH
jgi:transketolase